MDYEVMLNYVVLLHSIEISYTYSREQIDIYWIRYITSFPCVMNMGEDILLIHYAIAHYIVSKTYFLLQLQTVRALIKVM